MRLDDQDLEQALRQDRRLTPSPDFTDRVMRAVRRQADQDAGIEFPWRRFVWGVASCAAVTVAGIFAALLGGSPPPLDLGLPAALMQRPELVAALGWTTTALALSYALAWSSLRLAGHHR